MSLSEKKRLYAEARLSGKNQTEAALEAGADAKSAHVQGSRWERDPKIRAYIEAEQKRLAKKTGITRERWIRELAAVGFSNIEAYAAWGEGAMVLKPSKSLGRRDLKAILAIEERNTTNGPVMKLKLHNKEKALEILGRALGYFDREDDPGREVTEIKITVEDYTTDEDE